MKTILIIGASRGTGLETVRRALDQAYYVRAFARSASQIPLNHPHLTKISGDAMRTADVYAAVHGADAVILTLGAKPGFGMLSGTRLFSDATRILLTAVEAESVKRLICVTGFGAGDSRDHMPIWQRLPFELLLGRVYADKAVQEMMIKRSSLDWVIARLPSEQDITKSSISPPIGAMERSHVLTLPTFLSARSRAIAISGQPRR